MKRPRKRRASPSWQYVSPLLNELEWLDEMAEAEPVKTKANPTFRPSKSKRQTQTDTRKSGPAAKIKFAEGMEAVASKQSRRPLPPAPLILIDKAKKPRRPRASWLKDLAGIDPWSQQGEEFDDALQSFQLGLDGIMKSGEELSILPPRREPVVIDIEPEYEQEEWVMAGTQARQQAATPRIHAERYANAQQHASEHAGNDQADSPPDSNKPHLHQYGLIPFRFNSFAGWLDIVLAFEEHFADEGYALVATTNEPGCRTVIMEKSSDGAVVRLLRDDLKADVSGELNWIALGDQ